jgi:hypothetical protein
MGRRLHAYAQHHAEYRLMLFEMKNVIFGVQGTKISEKLIKTLLYPCVAWQKNMQFSL